jgi:hypothetical protein
VLRAGGKRRNAVSLCRLMRCPQGEPGLPQRVGARKSKIAPFINKRSSA